MKTLAVVILAFVVTGQARCPQDIRGGIAQTENMSAPAETVMTALARWRAILPDDPGGFRRYLKELAHDRDFDSLKVIYSSDIPYASWAAQETASAIGPAKVVAFCETFEPGSLNWQASFVALGYYEKGVGIDYIKRMAASTDPFVRCWCYRLCLSKGWSGLTEYAAKDTRDRSGFVLPNQTIPMVVCDLANKYLETFKDPSGDVLIPQVELTYVDRPENGCVPSDLTFILHPDRSLSTPAGKSVGEKNLGALLDSQPSNNVLVRIVLADRERTSAPDIYDTVCVIMKYCSPTKRTRIVAPLKWN